MNCSSIERELESSEYEDSDDIPLSALQSNLVKSMGREVDAVENSPLDAHVEIDDYKFVEHDYAMMDDGDTILSGSNETVKSDESIFADNKEGNEL